jgi:hypothetical protein
MCLLPFLDPEHIERLGQTCSRTHRELQLLYERQYHVVVKNELIHGNYRDTKWLTYSCFKSLMQHRMDPFSIPRYNDGSHLHYLTSLPFHLVHLRGFQPYAIYFNDLCSLHTKDFDGRTILLDPVHICGFGDYIDAGFGDCIDFLSLSYNEQVNLMTEPLFPPTLETIEFGCYFTLAIVPAYLPSNLRSIEFPSDYPIQNFDYFETRMREKKDCMRVTKRKK